MLGSVVVVTACLIVFLLRGVRIKKLSVTVTLYLHANIAHTFKFERVLNKTQTEFY